MQEPLLGYFLNISYQMFVKKRLATKITGKIQTQLLGLLII
jgi:hypothetical protein